MLLYEHFTKAHQVSTDSRSITPDAVFFALKGEKFDGNDFALEVAEKGVASLVVADRPSLPDHPRILKVKDSLQALQELARYHRQQMKNLKVISITGTNGKTTTKELVSSVLSQQYRIIYTQGNYNNHLGVPLTLLRITPETEIAVVEMGANHPGEIATLANIACPDYGLITNIGKAHLEGFGSFEGVIKTKNELYDYLKAHHRFAFVNDDNKLLMGLIGDLEHHTYGTSKNAQCQVCPTACNPYLSVTWNGIDIQTKLVGSYNAENVAAAIAVGDYFGVAPEKISLLALFLQPHNAQVHIGSVLHVLEILARAGNQEIPAVQFRGGEAGGDGAQDGFRVQVFGNVLFFQHQTDIAAVTLVPGVAIHIRDGADHFHHERRFQNVFHLRFLLIIV